MRNLIPTLTLAGTLALATLCEAGPRQRPTPPQPSVLSPQEEICEAYGKFAFARGMDRNNGIAMFTVLRLAREWDAQHNVVAASRAMHEAIIRGVYAADGQTMSPIGLQQVTETACIEGMERRTTATSAKDRY
jgi:hypothetical protein